jgi:dTDP-glucose 4,6-dehydratase
MRYFVTGGAGFIGSNYVEHLFRNVEKLTSVTIFDSFTYASNIRNYSDFMGDPRLRVVNGDVRDFNVLKEAMSGSDFVIHFAAESHVDRSIMNATDFVSTNIFGTYNVLEACTQLGVRTLISVSTDEVYGSIKSGEAEEKSPLLPNSPYAASKASSDLLCRSYSITHNLDVRITRCCNNFGKYQFPEKLIPLSIRSLVQGVEIPLYGDGTNIREWIHVSDHCKAIQLVLERGKPGEIYNIGSGVRHSNLDLVLLIIQAMGLGEDRIKFVEDRKGHDYRYAVTRKKILELGFNQKSDFHHNLKETIDWYSSNLDWWA